MRNLHKAVHDMQLKLIRSLLDFASSLPQRDAFNTKLGDHGTSKVCNILHVWNGPHE